jgi:hypothetical protein
MEEVMNGTGSFWLAAGAVAAWLLLSGLAAACLSVCSLALVGIVSFLWKAPSPRWRRAAKRSLLGFTLAFLVCAPAGFVAILMALQTAPTVPAAAPFCVSLGLVYVCFGVLAIVGGPIETVVVMHCGWRAIWKPAAEVADCVAKAESKARRRWVNRALVPLLLIGGLALILVPLYWAHNMGPT